MRIYLGGYLDFYHPQKRSWLVVELAHPKPLAEILEAAGIPLAEVQLVVINGQQAELQTAVVSDRDEVKLYSAVGGG